MRRWLVLLACLAPAARADEIDDAKKRWETSPHGPMLERILPPTFEARAAARARLARARGSRCATACSATTCPTRRCTTRRNGRRSSSAWWCAWRAAATWARLMAEMMAGVKAPAPEETQDAHRLPAEARADAARPEALSRGEPALGRGLPPRLQPVPRAARPAAPHRGGMARGGGAHAGEHGVDEPRGRHAARLPAASRSCGSRKSTPSSHATRGSPTADAAAG